MKRKQNKMCSKCLLRLVIVRVSCYSKCFTGHFVHGALKPDLIYIRTFLQYCYYNIIVCVLLTALIQVNFKSAKYA